MGMRGSTNTVLYSDSRLTNIIIKLENCSSRRCSRRARGRRKTFLFLHLAVVQHSTVEQSLLGLESTWLSVKGEEDLFRGYNTNKYIDRSRSFFLSLFLYGDPPRPIRPCHALRLFLSSFSFLVIAMLFFRRVMLRAAILIGDRPTTSSSLTCLPRPRPYPPRGWGGRRS